ncbi:MAG: hypothetical protein J6E46_09525 [Faecalicoccus sp.]|nr:hypothetical protein [Faecalicoccus sp.]
MEKLKEYFWMALILILGVVTYFGIPYLLRYLAENMHGMKALMIIAGITCVGTFLYYLWGYRGRELIYVALIILFLMGMVWLYFNYRTLDVYISSTYGQLTATAVFILIIVAIWLFVRYFL